MINKIYYQHLPLKKFSQNFLIDKNIIKKIIQHINPNKNELLVEIGPGLGALTEPICHILNHLIVIEIDSNLLEKFTKDIFFKKLIVFYQNALHFNYKKLFDEKKKLIRVFGNLPYNISTALMIDLFKNITVIRDMNFMLQKEVAHRLTASPGSKSYGRLSILAQYYCSIKIILEVSPKSFFPIPQVNSAFVHLMPHKHYPVLVQDVNMLSRVTNLAFQHRRKMIHHSLSSVFSIQRLIDLGINPTLRADHISVSQYCNLANCLS